MELPPLNNINQDTNYDLERDREGNSINLPASSTQETITVLELLKDLTTSNTVK